MGCYRDDRGRSAAINAPLELGVTKVFTCFRCFKRYIFERLKIRVIESLVGVLVGGLITTVSALIVQRRSARTVARSDIYMDLIGRARLEHASSASSQTALQVIHSLRRRAVLLSRSEREAAVEAERLLMKAQKVLADERRTGRPSAAQYMPILKDYDSQLDVLERIISRRLRWPT
jgi:hypothetical protein